MFNLIKKNFNRAKGLVVRKQTKPAQYKKIIVTIVDANQLENNSEPYGIIFEDSLWNGIDGAKKAYLDIINHLNQTGFTVNDKSKWNNAAEQIKTAIRMDKRVKVIKAAADKIAKQYNEAEKIVAVKKITTKKVTKKASAKLKAKKN